jgi:hypothetical protein
LSPIESRVPPPDSRTASNVARRTPPASAPSRSPMPTPKPVPSTPLLSCDTLTERVTPVAESEVFVLGLGGAGGVPEEPQAGEGAAAGFDVANRLVQFEDAAVRRL